jgi:hypothetical protein
MKRDMAAGSCEVTLEHLGQSLWFVNELAPRPLFVRQCHRSDLSFHFQRGVT